MRLIELFPRDQMPKLNEKKSWKSTFLQFIAVEKLVLTKTIDIFWRGQINLLEEVQANPDTDKTTVTHKACQYFFPSILEFGHSSERSDFILYITSGWGESHKNAWGLGKLSLWGETEEVDVVCDRRRGIDK